MFDASRRVFDRLEEGRRDEVQSANALIAADATVWRLFASHLRSSLCVGSTSYSASSSY